MSVDLQTLSRQIGDTSLGRDLVEAAIVLRALGASDEEIKDVFLCKLGGEPLRSALVFNLSRSLREKAVS